MSERRRLPNFRESVSIGIEYGGFCYRATASFFDDGALAEIFLDVPGKLGTPLQANADNQAILASLLLQHGVNPSVIRHSITGPVALALERLEAGR